MRHTVDRLFEHCIRHHPNGDQQRIKDASSHQPGLRASPAAQEEYRQEGEEQKEFRSRCVRGMLCQVDRLCKENVESAAFVVHGGTIMAVLEQLAEDQKDFYHWQVENGGGYRMLVNEDEWKSGIHRFRKIQKLGGVTE